MPDQDPCETVSTQAELLYGTAVSSRKRRKVVPQATTQSALDRVDLGASWHASLSMLRQPSTDVGQGRNLERELSAMGSTGITYQLDAGPLPATTQLLPVPQPSPSSLYFLLHTETTRTGGDISTAGAPNWYDVSHAPAGSLREISGTGCAALSSCVGDLRIHEPCGMGELNMFGQYLWD